MLESGDVVHVTLPSSTPLATAQHTARRHAPQKEARVVRAGRSRRLWVCRSHRFVPFLKTRRTRVSLFVLFSWFFGVLWGRAVGG